MPRRQNTDIAPRIRGAFIRACEVNRKRGKDLTMLIADKLIEDPLNTLKAIAPFNPRQMNVDMSVDVNIENVIALAQQRQAMTKDVTPKVQDKCSTEPQAALEQASTVGAKPTDEDA